MGEHAGRRVDLALGQAEQLLPELVRRLHVPSIQIIRHQPPQHRKELRGVAKLLTQLPGAGVGAFHVGGGMPLDRHQRRAQRHLEVQLLVPTCGRLGQAGQRGQTLRQLRHRFHMRRALQGALARPLPIAHGGLRLARLGIVMRQQLRLRLCRLREVRFQPCAIR